MARQMDMSVMIRLVDKITGPISSIMNKLKGLVAMGGRLSAMSRQIGIIGGALAAISLAGPITSAAAWDQKMRESVVTAGFFGDAARKEIASLTLFYNELALKVGLTSNSLADAGNLLISSGLDAHLTQKLLPTIGRVAKAASAIPEDVAAVAFALTNSMGIATDKMEETLSKLIVAGKLGRFEFKDMAKYIPSLAAEFDKFGLKGQKAIETMAASLQVAMFGTSDTSAAANNFKNYLAKLLAPETKERFQKFGVDIAGVMQNAAARGLDPVEASYQKVLQLTGLSQEKVLSIFNANKGKGMNDVEATAAALEQIRKIAGAEKLGALFGDMEVLNFMLPMMANIDKYQKFKKEIAAAGLDEIAKDFATQWEGLETQMTVAGEMGWQAVNRIGLAFAKNLPWLNEWGKSGINWMRDMDAKYPGLIDNVLMFGGAVLMGVAALAVLGPVVAAASAGLGVLMTVIGALFTPIGAIAAAIVASAIIIYQHWDEFAGYFTRIWEGVKGVFGGAADYLTALFAGDFGGMLAGLQRIMDGAGNIVGGIAGHITGLASHMWDALRSFAGDAGAWLEEKLGAEVVGKIKSPFDGLIAWFGGLAGRIIDAIGSIDVGSLIKWPSLPSWLGGGEAAPAANGTAAPGAGKVGQLAPASAVAGNTQVGGQITVSAAPGTQIESVKSSNPDVPLKTATTGRVVGRV